MKEHSLLCKIHFMKDSFEKSPLFLRSLPGLEQGHLPKLRPYPVPTIFDRSCPKAKNQVKGNTLALHVMTRIQDYYVSAHNFRLHLVPQTTSEITERYSETTCTAIALTEALTPTSLGFCSIMILAMLHNIPVKCLVDTGGTVTALNVLGGKVPHRYNKHGHNFTISVLMLSSLPHLITPQMLPLYSPSISIIRNMTNNGQGRTVFNNCAWGLGPNMASY